MKYRKGNYLLGSYDVDRHQDENLRETFQEQLNIKLKSLEFDNPEDVKQKIFPWEQRLELQLELLVKTIKV